MAGKVHQFPGTRPAPQEEPEVDLEAQLKRLQEHFEEVAKELKEDASPNASILTVLTTNSQSTVMIWKLGEGMDLPGLAFGLLRAQRVLSDQGD